jgi:hypothetical protein
MELMLDRFLPGRLQTSIDSAKTSHLQAKAHWLKADLPLAAGCQRLFQIPGCRPIKLEVQMLET